MSVIEVIFNFYDICQDAPGNDLFKIEHVFYFPT